MNRQSLLSIFTVALNAAACSQSPTSRPLSVEESASPVALEDVVSRYYLANQELDGQAFAATFAIDGAWFDEAGQNPVVGRDAISAQFAAAGQQIGGGVMRYPIYQAFRDHALVLWSFDVYGHVPADALAGTEPRRTTWNGTTAFRFAPNGEIAEARVFWDAANQIAALAGVPGPLPGIPENNSGTDLTQAAVKNYFKALGALDAQEFAETFADDGTLDDAAAPAPVKGKGTIRNFFASVSANLASAEVEYALDYSYQGLAATRWTLNVAGKAGGRARWFGHTIFTVDHDGKIAETIVFWDSNAAFSALDLSAKKAERSRSDASFAAYGFDAPESAVYDPETDAVYVSNQGGNPVDLTRDGKGFISKVGRDGTIENLKLVEGLDRPHGLVMADGKLWAAELGAAVEIDVRAGTILRRIELPNAVMPNDIAASSREIYVSDSFANTIYRIERATGETRVLAAGAELDTPNGLLVRGDELLVLTMGDMRNFPAGLPGDGHLGGILSISLKTGKISSFTKTPLGRLDGIAADDEGNLLVSDFVAGTIYRVDGNSKAVSVVLDGLAGVADISIGSNGDLLVPETYANGLVSIKAGVR